MKPFPWRPRMAATSSLSPHLLTVIVVRDGMAFCSLNVGVPGAEHVRSDWFRLETLKPVEDDPATLGALLAEVQRVWGFDDLHPRHVHEGRMPNTWNVTPPTGDEPPFREGWGFIGRCVKEQELARRVGVQATKWDAVMAAWWSQP